MRVNLSEIYGDTITLINKLDAKHALLKQDAYYATVLHNCMWSDEFANGVSSSGVVTPTTIHRIQIPAYEGQYIPYMEWRKMEGRENYFTLRTDDYIVRGEITENVDATTIRSIISEFEPNAFQVRAWRELTIPDHTKKTLGGLPVYRFSLEG